jgi:alpha-acetolactate decarboxylase
MSKNVLYQYSVMSALMSGAASSGVSLAHILQHGNHGLGTFKHLEGEMVILDGHMYQIKSDGSVTPDLERDHSDWISPFAMITPFEPTITTKVTFSSKSNLAAKISALFPKSQNYFLSFRIDGEFEQVGVRTVGGQLNPHEKLLDVGKRQTTHTFPSIKGSIIGFRTPEYFQGISVAGDHMHLISEDRKFGGHLQACEASSEVTITASTNYHFNVEFPEHDEDFSEVDLLVDHEGIKTVEG